MNPSVITVDNPVECTIVKRVNRFVVEIKINGKLHKACINNTGRLNDYLLEGSTGFCIKNKHRLKTEYRLFAIKEGNYAAIIDTQLQMKAFETILANRLLPWIKECTLNKRSPRLGGSVIDYLLECGNKEVYLEAKSAVLREGCYAMYPDCPSARGRRHIKDLAIFQASGGASAILFIAALPGVNSFKPCRMADPELYNLLVQAHDLGVAIKAISIHYNPLDCSIYLVHPDLPVEL